MRSFFKSRNVEINFEAMTVSRDGAEVRLTRIEFSLLRYLAQNINKVLTFAELMEKLWGQNSLETEHNLEVHICNLRKKIETDGFRITNVYVTGFRLDIDENNLSSS